MDLNKVILVGRVTADPQVRSTPGGQSVTTIGVATNRTWTDKQGQKQEQTEFHNVVLWGRTAEIAGQYLTKGAMVLIEGRLQTRSWTDKQGQQRKTTESDGGAHAARSARGERRWRWRQDRAGARSFGSGTPSSAPAQGGDADAVPSLDEIPVINLEEDEIKPEDIPF